MTAQDAQAILSFPIAYRGGDAGGGLTLNGHRDTSGNVVQANVEDSIIVEKFDFSPLEFRDQRDGLHLLYGGDLGMVSDEFRFLSATGFVTGSTAAVLEDRVASLLSVFDPVNCMAASPSTRGVLPLDFYCPTATPPAGYTSPVHEVFYGRPTGLPAIFERRATGYSMLFALQLICPDTRRYMFTAESKVANAGNSWTIAVPNWTAKMGAPTKGTVTLALTGTGSSNCTLRYVDTVTGVTTDLVLDLSGISAAGHTVVVDVGTGIITLDGAVRADLRTSAVDTAIWTINANGGTFSIPTGRTALTSGTLAYRQARA